MSIKDETIKIAMVGISGTGKSSFISSLNQKFIISSTNGITILPRKEEQDEFFSVGELSNYSVNNEIGTDRTTIYKLKLKVDTDIVCNFDFIDYRGGILDDMFKQNKNKEEVEITKEYIRNSDAILVMVDSVMLSKYDENKRKIATGADKINPLFNIFEDELSNRGMSLLLLLSKSDSSAINPEDKANNYTLLANKALTTFNIVYECAKRQIENNWNFGILPITSMGEGNSITTEVVNKNIDDTINSLPVSYVSKLKKGAYPTSKNIDVALLYSITEALKSKVNRYENEIQIFENTLKKLELEKDKNKSIISFGKKAKVKQDLDSKINILKERISLDKKEEEKIKEDIDKILQKVNVEDEILFSF